MSMGWLGDDDRLRCDILMIEAHKVLNITLFYIIIQLLGTLKCPLVSIFILLRSLKKNIPGVIARINLDQISNPFRMQIYL